jgi:hypothetical protein
MNGHAEDPFQVTPRAPRQGVGIADLDQVPMP